jgi:hypothetical protein
VQDGNEFILLRVPKLLRARWRSKRRNPLDNLDRPRDHYCSQVAASALHGRWNRVRERKLIRSVA